MEQLLIPYQATEAIPAKAVVVFAPHPDDEIFGCGGTLARHAAAGVPVHPIIVTDGAFSASAEERQDIVATREAESLAAAAALGIPPPAFWRMPDRGLQYGEVLIERLVEAIRKHGADLVYAPSLHEAHPDHRVLAMAAVEAVRRIGTAVRLAMYEIGVPLRPNALVDITSLLERKRTAMRCFASQLEKQRYDEQIEALNRYRAYTLPPECTAAEAFTLVDAAAIAAHHLDLFASEYQRQHGLGLPMDGERDFPLVSVIIRSMDRPTLAEALDSLALQTYANIEVLVVNAKGGNHSGLGEQCGRLPLRLLNRSGQPLDRSAAANAGLDAVRGAYFAFLDDDDTLDPDHFAKLVAAARPLQEATVVYAGVRSLDRNAHAETTPHIFADRWEDGKLLAGNFIPIHAALVPTGLLAKGLRFDTGLRVYEDWDFWLQVSQHARFALSPDVTATYYLDGGSGVNPHSVDPAVMRQATLAIYAKWLPRLDTDGLWLLTRLYHDRNASLHGCYGRVGTLEYEAADLREKLAVANYDLNDARNELGMVRDELSAFRAMLDSIYNSYSWRITAPLRALTNLLRRAPPSSP
jgi:LmbE family N-acetylglucosaminyl deacetylase/glycosyltransferase involved in cell wall biosynthesis